MMPHRPVLNTVCKAIAVVLIALFGLTAASLRSTDATTTACAAELLIQIDLSDQEMQTFLDEALQYRWPISTARRGYRTPTGRFKPQRLERMWYSTKYDNAPMPHSIFFHGGYAIHGTTEVGNLGRPVSHGCVRLHPDHAAILFDLVKRVGAAATEILIVQ